MVRFINDKIRKLDNAPLWILGIPFLILLFAPYVAMGKGSVFEIMDQLDETLFTYVATARHLFEGADLYPEMMGGIAPGGMFPAAVLFVPLSLALVWTEFHRVWEWVRLVVMAVMVFPTALLVKNSSNLYDNVNQYNHGSAYTGKITWEERRRAFMKYGFIDWMKIERLSG